MEFLLLAVLILFLVYILNNLFKKAHDNTKDVVINKIKLNEKLVPQYPKLKILQLSDLHLENISISPTDLYEMLKDEPIDLIALTGDFLDRKRTIPKLAPYLETLNKLNPKHGIYAVLGNHDYFLRPKYQQKLIEILEQYNCKVLINQHDVIYVNGKPVNIIGIDDFKTKRSDINASYKGIVSGTKLVLTHDPNIVLHMKNYHFDYLLSGHFHGGQICYPKAYHLVKMGKLARMNITKGLHLQDGKPYYINEGLGQTGVNIRVGSRPEITLHELPLRPKKAAI
ncbi:putative phosphohydrolase [Schinkia azotoformans MEV2011]|uniref:Putative phosphohydrolase n=1 Tax=Schinkia azotoformans MEV2011 TaxID=1348973 RepID=A0A072NF51_SCHAZ|nr:metallophosphoesterase [Schinkia azotoformans]KEF35862.1 putative phosphohydrolase [Schinkia azotoformans MEV2011]MEC1696921.1 metallophosphoesterase [Schinkia azotoformans]MEC1723349.1 metallophosphoesterase [Schinkia azotoformans]MEC1742972.1 metallophosphoesterase [Schinkia azotoformans]MEC1745352.1 metallophosphoesterase [Schinkia azotoformans]